MIDRSMEAGNVITVIGDGACDSIGFISREERDRTYYKAKEECQEQTEDLLPEGLQPG
jgi:hypothetical protein